MVETVDLNFLTLMEGIDAFTTILCSRGHNFACLVDFKRNSTMRFPIWICGLLQIRFSAWKILLL